MRKILLNADRHYILGYIYLQNGDYIKSMQELEKAIELNPIPQPYYLYLGIAYSKAGKLDETKKILAKLDSLEKAGNKVSFGKALLLAELGDTEQSILLLEKGYEERHQYMLYLKCVPIMCSSIRTDPGFIEIYKKLPDVTLLVRVTRKPSGPDHHCPLSPAVVTTFLSYPAKSINQILISDT